MARCRLGPKLVRKIERICGRRVAVATVRGGTAHYWARVVFVDDTQAYVNYRTGAFDSSDVAAAQHLYKQMAAHRHLDAAGWPLTDSPEVETAD